MHTPRIINKTVLIKRITVRTKICIFTTSGFIFNKITTPWLSKSPPLFSSNAAFIFKTNEAKKKLIWGENRPRSGLFVFNNPLLERVRSRKKKYEKGGFILITTPARNYASPKQFVRGMQMQKPYKQTDRVTFAFFTPIQTNQSASIKSVISI